MLHNTGANAFAKNQMRLAYEDKRDLYCIYIYRPNDKVVVCMLLDARDTYPTKSDHIIILVYLYVFGCVLCLCCQLMFMTS